MMIQIYISNPVWISSSKIIFTQWNLFYSFKPEKIIKSMKITISQLASNKQNNNKNINFKFTILIYLAQY